MLLALAVLILGVTWLKDFQLGRKSNVWHVSFEQSGGLGVSDEVHVNGIRMGSVLTMKLDGDHVLVDLAISNGIHPTTDSRFAIRSVGLMGEREIDIDYRPTGRPYTTRDTIPGIYEKGLSEVLSDLGNTMNSVSGIAGQLSAMVGVMDKSGDLSAALKSFRKTSEQLQATVTENRADLRRALADFAATAHTARGLTTDREAQLKRTMDHFAAAAENMERLSARLDSLRASLQIVSGRIERGQGTLGKLVNDDKLYTDLSASIQSLKSLIEDVKAHPKKYLSVRIF